LAFVIGPAGLIFAPQTQAYRSAMFQKIRSLFKTRPRLPAAPFVDPVLGAFEFDSDLGWKKRLDFGETEAELVIGSDGEIPSDDLIRTARLWVQRWRSEKPRILDYIRNELRQWTFEPNLPDPDRFTLQSVHVLWPHEPNACMIYLDYPGDEDRSWHVTFDGTTPRGFAYDH